MKVFTVTFNQLNASLFNKLTVMHIYIYIYTVCTQYYYSVLYEPACSVINQACILLVTVSSKYACYTFLSVRIALKGLFTPIERAANSKRWLSAARFNTCTARWLQSTLCFTSAVNLTSITTERNMPPVFIYTRKAASSSMNYDVANSLWLINDNVPQTEAHFCACMQVLLTVEML